MLKIDNENNITITKGDTLTLTLNLKKDGDDYVPVEGDTIRFAVSKGFVGETAYQLLIEENVPVDSLTFTVSSEKMELLSHASAYNYDVELTHGDGSVDTVISAQIKVLGEVK